MLGTRIDSTWFMTNLSEQTEIYHYPAAAGAQALHMFPMCFDYLFLSYFCLVADDAIVVRESAPKSSRVV